MTARSFRLLWSSVGIGLFLISIARLASQTAAPPPLTMLSRDGRRTIPVVTINNDAYVALDDLAAIFQLSVRDESLNATTVSYKGKTIVLTPDQPLASVAGRLVSLPAPPVHTGRRWFVPVEFLGRALGLVYDAKLDLRKSSNLLIVGDLRVPKVTIRYDPAGGGGRLTIDAAPRATNTVSQDGQHLTVRFDADALDVSTPPFPASSAPEFLVAIRVQDTTALAIDLGPRVAGFRATTVPAQPSDPTSRLVIDLLPITAPGEPPGPPAAQAPPPELPAAFSAPTSPIRTIAIDPGHGGEDEGTHGAAGTKEKDLTLAVARRIKAAIESRLGIRVLLTREDDRQVPIDARAALANNNKADLFVSLHANASPRPSTAGATIYLAAFEPDAVRALGTPNAERVPTFGGGLRDIELVPWEFAQTRHLDESAAFAALLEQAFRDHVPLATRAIDHAPLRVLASANMPAVLIEMGYLTNPDQEKLVAGADFQMVFVQTFIDAMLKFRDALSGGAR